MKLRYLHLQDYPPIKDIKVLFASGSPLQRECAIRFVVGVNGSGKSNLLRAIAEVFLALSEQRVPQFPVSLIYELGVRGTASHRTLVLDCSGNRFDASLWVSERFTWSDDADVDAFDAALLNLRENTEPPVHGFTALIPPGDWPSRATSPPQMALPNAVLAYTTGAMRPWQALWQRSQDSNDVELVSQGDDYDPSAERPIGWSVAQEMAIQNEGMTLSTEYDGSNGTFEDSLSADLFRRPLLLTPALLKCALLVITLQEAYLTLDSGFQENMALRASESRNKNALSPLQRLLERGGWHYLVSAAFRCRLQPKLWSPNICKTAHDWLLCAGEVIADPHPTEMRRTLYFDLKGPFKGDANTFFIDGDALAYENTQGAALMVLLGGVRDTPPYQRFLNLVKLHQAGLFDDVELRLRRQAKPDEASDNDDSDNDIGVLRFEELSDGEQMVLGRMALFHLLEGQHDSLLLLDEPETHFNDKWKREIVDIIDSSIGSTANDVLISTHSSIVLSDVFNDEIVMVEKTDNGSVVRKVSEQTFATDPSALMMTVFEADDSIGKRAQEFIESKLSQTTGSPEDIKQLEQLVARMGSGFYRSELRTLLNRWKGEKRD